MHRLFVFCLRLFGLLVWYAFFSSFLLLSFSCFCRSSYFVGLICSSCFLFFFSLSLVFQIVSRLTFRFFRLGLVMDEALLYSPQTSLFHRGSSFSLIICQKIRHRTKQFEPLQIVSVSLDIICTEVVMQRNADGTTSELVRTLHSLYALYLLSFSFSSSSSSSSSFFFFVSSFFCFFVCLHGSVRSFPARVRPPPAHLRTSPASFLSSSSLSSSAFSSLSSSLSNRGIYSSLSSSLEAASSFASFLYASGDVMAADCVANFPSSLIAPASTLPAGTLAIFTFLFSSFFVSSFCCSHFLILFLLFFSLQVLLSILELRGILSFILHGKLSNMPRNLRFPLQLFVRSPLIELFLFLLILVRLQCK